MPVRVARLVAGLRRLRVRGRPVPPLPVTADVLRRGVVPSEGGSGPGAGCGSGGTPAEPAAAPAPAPGTPAGRLRLRLRLPGRRRSRLRLRLRLPGRRRSRLRLGGRDLHGPGRVGDVEDADARRHLRLGRRWRTRRLRTDGRAPPPRLPPDARHRRSQGQVPRSPWEPRNAVHPPRPGPGTATRSPSPGRRQRGARRPAARPDPLGGAAAGAPRRPARAAPARQR